MAIVMEDQSHRLRGCFFAVQNEVGLGRDEEVYHQGMVRHALGHRLPIQSKPPHWISLAGRQVYCMFPDFVAWDSITIELKSVARQFEPSEFAQLMDYLKFRDDRLGLLVNMGLGRVLAERIVYSPTSTRLCQDWDSWKGRLSGREQNIGRRVRAFMQALDIPWGIAVNFGKTHAEFTALSHHSRT